MPTLNPFENNDAFTMASLTDAINILPNKYGRIEQMGLMPVRGVRTRTIMIEEKNGVLNLLQTLPPGSPGQQNKMGKHTVRSFVIPHIPLDDQILPEEYNGIRAFGSENAMAALVTIMNDHMQTMKDKHAITLEHLRMGALKGQILDADGTTLYDLFTEFGITKKFNKGNHADLTTGRDQKLDIVGYRMLFDIWFRCRHWGFCEKCQNPWPAHQSP